MMQVFSLEIVVLCSLLALALTVIWLVTLSLKQNHTKRELQQSVKLINDLYGLYQEQQGVIDILQRSSLDQDVSNLNTQMQNALQNIEYLTTRMNDIEHSTDLLTQQEPGLRMYNKASQMAQADAHIEDIMEACELPRAEVEVLVSLHKKTKR